LLVPVLCNVTSICQKIFTLMLSMGNSHKWTVSFIFLLSCRFNVGKHRDKNSLSRHVNEINGPTIKNGIGKMCQQGRIVTLQKRENRYCSEHVTVGMPNDISHMHCPTIETQFRFQANRCGICSGKLLEQGFLEYYGFPLLLSSYH